MKISVTQLRAISNTLWTHLEASGYEEIELQHDYYWHIPKDRIYDFRSEPTEHTAGQLTDDWESLQKVLNPDREPIAYDLVWLAAILRAIGEQIVS